MEFLLTNDLSLSLSFFGATLLCLALLKIAVITGKKIGLVDRPNERKKHKGEIPLVGGICIFITFLVMQNFHPASTALIIACSILLLVGIIDDYHNLTPKSRLLFQGMAASVLVIGGGFQILTVGNLFFNSVVLLTGMVSIVFTIICIIGVVNAINMIDGADCLAGGIVAVSIVALLIVSGSQAEFNTALISSLVFLLGAILAFLIFNSGVLGTGHKVFLGDSGSMFLGAILATYFILMSQGENAQISPVTAGWFFGLPLIDSVSVMVRRLSNGKSPLRAGRDHLHHRLVDNGMSSSRCVVTMLISHAVIVTIGLVGHQLQFSDAVMFWSFITLVFGHHFVSPMLNAYIPMILTGNSTDGHSVKR